MATTQIWQAQQLNSSGIRRAKLLDADSVKIMPIGVGTANVSLLAQSDVMMYEFLFPADLACVASWTLGKKESGSHFWIQSLSFTLPHLQDAMLSWVNRNGRINWLAVIEDYNGTVRLLGGSPTGLQLSFQGSSGANPRDTNPMVISLAGEQFGPYLNVTGYEDAQLLPTSPGFTIGYSLGFEA